MSTLENVAKAVLEELQQASLGCIHRMLQGGTTPLAGCLATPQTVC